MLKTRKAAGSISWPTVLIAGRDKAGKSWMSAEASGSDLIDTTYWLSVGELDPDEYANVPGAGEIEIVEHDGTWEAIMQVAAEIASLPREGKPNLLVVDSGSRLWKLILGDMQEIANERARSRNNGVMPNHAVELSSDLWYLADSRWQQFMQALRLHHGPVIITARLNSWITNDGERQDRMQTEKTLPYDADAIIELPERGEKWLSGVRSTKISLSKPERSDELSVDELWRLMGLDTTKAAERPMVELKPRAR